MPKATIPTTAAQPRDYSKGAWSSKLTDLECPSGQWAQVKRPGLQGLLNAGVLESTDQLTSIVQNVTIPKAEGKDEIDVTKVMSDPKKLNELLSFIDTIVLHVVKQPDIHAVPVQADLDAYNLEHSETEGFVPLTKLDELRDDNLIYVDEIDIDDKTFIVNFALGGSKDLETFRKKSAEALGSVAAEQEAADKTE